MAKEIEIEVVVDSLATISDILYNKFYGVQCVGTELCGPIFMDALNTLRQAGTIQRALRRRSARRHSAKRRSAKKGT